MRLRRLLQRPTLMGFKKIKIIWNKIQKIITYFTHYLISIPNSCWISPIPDLILMFILTFFTEISRGKLKKVIRLLDLCEPIFIVRKAVFSQQTSKGIMDLEEFIVPFGSLNHSNPNNELDIIGFPLFYFTPLSSWKKCYFFLTHHANFSDDSDFITFQKKNGFPLKSRNKWREFLSLILFPTRVMVWDLPRFSPFI